MKTQRPLRWSKERLTAAREKAGLSQRQLAPQIGMSNTAVSLWERGLCIPSAEALARICFVLQIQPADLFDTAA